MRSWLMAMGGTAHSEASDSTGVRNRHTTNVVCSEQHSARPAGFACSWPGLRLDSSLIGAKQRAGVTRVCGVPLLAAANAGARCCSSSAIASRRAQRGEGSIQGGVPSCASHRVGSSSRCGAVRIVFVSRCLGRVRTRGPWSFSRMIVACAPCLCWSPPAATPCAISHCATFVERMQFPFGSYQPEQIVI